MLQSEFYQGLPSELWDSLINEVEEVLRAEEIGTHVLGIYPSGNRIFGIESSSPQLICLYLDTPEDILNPAIRREMSNTKFFKTYTTNIDTSSIYFIEIHSWIQWITLRFSHSHPDRLRNLLDMIPCHEDIVYQDPSLDHLIEMTRDYLSRGGLIADIGFKRSYSSHITFPSYEQLLEEALYLRTIYLYDKTNKFSPNVHKDWGTVISIPHKAPVVVQGFDETLRESVMKNTRMNMDELQEYVHSIRSVIKLRTDPDERLAMEMGKEVVKLYKFIL